MQAGKESMREIRIYCGKSQNEMTLKREGVERRRGREEYHRDK